MNVNVFVLVHLQCLLVCGIATENNNRISTPGSMDEITTTSKPTIGDDYVRCFCNLPLCVTSSYMCKSLIGCFSNFSDDVFSVTQPKASQPQRLHQRNNIQKHQEVDHNYDDNYLGLHGCLNLLTDEQTHHEEWCHVSHNMDRKMCCYEDMCNHIDSRMNRFLMNRIENSFERIGDGIVHSGLNQNNYENTIINHGGYTDSEVWFRAATIAVPICGAIILLVLIVLAVKILQSEQQTNVIDDKYGATPNCVEINQKYRLAPPQYHRIPLLVQNPIDDHRKGAAMSVKTLIAKNETNAKLNNCSGTLIIPTQLVASNQASPQHSYNDMIILDISKSAMTSSNVNNAVNFLVDYSDHYSHKICDKRVALQCDANGLS